MAKPQSTTTDWSDKWNPEDFKKGLGVVGEGVIKTIRLHSVVSKQGSSDFLLFPLRIPPWRFQLGGNDS